jgi:hypothetical protein
MMYANLGNIDTYITARYSMPDDGRVFDTSGQADGEAEPLSVDEMKRLFRRRRLSSRAGDPGGFRRQDVRGILLFSREEIESLFGDILEGLEFLVSRNESPARLRGSQYVDDHVLNSMGKVSFTST